MIKNIVILSFITLVVACTTKQTQNDLPSKWHHFKKDTLLTNSENISKGFVDTFTIRNRKFRIYQIDSSRESQSLVEYYENNYWHTNLDSFSSYRMWGREDDYNFDGYNDITNFYNRNYCTYLFNPTLKIFEKEEICFSNSAEILDSANLLFFNNPFFPIENYIYQLYQIKQNKRIDLFDLVTSEFPNKKGLFTHYLYKGHYEYNDEVNCIDSFYDNKDHMSFDYEKYWRKILVKYPIQAK